MKRYLQAITIALLFLFIPGCSAKQEIKTNETIKEPINTSSESVVKQEISLVAKTGRAEYLQSNAIEFSNVQKTVDTSKEKSNYNAIQIGGLKNKSIEMKINKAILEDMGKSIITYADKTNENIEWFSGFNELNVNNLLSISMTVYEYDFMGGLLYRLTDGKRLYLKDIFTKETDYVSLLNRKIVEKIIGGNDEESDILMEPFSTISPDQNFILRESSLRIIFLKGEAGFIRNYYIDIPLAEIDDYVDILDRQELNRDIFEKPYDVVKYNNIFIKNEMEIADTPNGGIWLEYVTVTGMKDPALEKYINNTIRSGIDEVLNSSCLKEKKLSTPAERYGFINMYITFNNYGYLCISSYGDFEDPNIDYEDMSRVYTFDLKEGTLVDPRDILRAYADKNSGFKIAFTEAVKGNLKKQYEERKPGDNDKELHRDMIDKTIDYSFIIDNCRIYFQSKTYPTKPSIVVYFKQNLIDIYPQYAYIEFYKDLNMLPEAFFRM